MDRRIAIESLAPVHAAALRLLDGGAPPAQVAASLGLDLDELGTLVRVAEAKVARLVAEPSSAAPDFTAEEEQR